MRHQEREAHDFWGSVAEHVTDSDEVALRLSHLDTADGQHAVVQPKPRERVAAMGADALGNLVFVVREDQIETAAVDVESLAEFGISLIAEHSMCQPGRPRPQGLSQPGMSGPDGFHSTKSPGSSL